MVFANGAEVRWELAGPLLSPLPGPIAGTGNISRAAPREVLTGQVRLVYKPATLTAGGRPLLWCGLEPALA